MTEKATQGVLAVDVTSPTGGRRFWFDNRNFPENRNGGTKPTFRISEVARFFFARSADWMRWLVSEHGEHGNIFLLDGEELEIERTASGARTYTLRDIEKIAVALHVNHKISTEQFLSTMHILVWVGNGYKIIESSELLPREEPTNSADQLVIPAIDEAIEAITHQCVACVDGNHEDCLVVCELAFLRSASVQDVAAVSGEAKLVSSCACFDSNPQIHGAEIQ